MSNAVNAVINNLSDRLGDVVEAIGPMVETAGAISTTVVEETSRTGFVYTMLGLVFLGIAGILSVCFVRESRRPKKEGQSGDACGLFGVGITFSALVGVITIMCSLTHWLAPTKEVIREVIKNI